MDVEQDHVGEALVDELDGGVGLVGLAHDLDGVAQLGLDAGPEHGVVLDQEDAGAAAARRRVIGHDPLAPGHGELDLGALAGGGTDDDRATVSSHAGPDGLGDALAVLGHRIGIEALAPVAHEEVDAVGLHLGVERDLVGPGLHLAALTVASWAASSRARSASSVRSPPPAPPGR